MEITQIIRALPHFKHKFMNEKMKDENISSMCGPYLMLIASHNGCSMKDLSFHTCFDKAYTSRVIKELEEKNVIEKEIDEKDRRKSKIRITEKGKSIVKKIEKYDKEWQEISIKNIKEEELKKLQEILTKIYKNVSQYEKGCNRK